MMTDDHTTQAMSCYGGRLLQTPNMDRIANEGIRMTIAMRSMLYPVRQELVS